MVGEVMGTKRMGKLGKLSDFSKSSAASQPDVSNPQSVSEETPTHKTTTQQDKLVSVNIKIPRSQQEWLADTAQLVRDNNIAPVLPSERVYPQHLIGVAIELLRSTDVDWEQIRNIEDLLQQLKLNG